jgi:hypothetical protein
MLLTFKLLPILRGNLNIWDNNIAVVDCIWRRTVSSRWLHCGVNEFFWVFIKIRSCVVFLISLLQPFCSWHTSLARLIELWMTPLFRRWGWLNSMSRFPVHFRAQYWTPFHDQNIQERKDIIGFNFRYEIYDRFNPVDIMKKLLQSYWSMCTAHFWGSWHTKGTGCNFWIRL